MGSNSKPATGLVAASWWDHHHEGCQGGGDSGVSTITTTRHHAPLHLAVRGAALPKLENSGPVHTFSKTPIIKKERVALNKVSTCMAVPRGTSKAWHQWLEWKVHEVSFTRNNERFW